MESQKVATAIVVLRADVAALDLMLEHPEDLATQLSPDTIKALTFARDRFQTLLSVLDPQA